MPHYFYVLLKFVFTEGEPSPCIYLHNKALVHATDQSVLRHSLSRELRSILDSGCAFAGHHPTADTTGIFISYHFRSQATKSASKHLTVLHLHAYIKVFFFGFRETLKLKEGLKALKSE